MQTVNDALIWLDSYIGSHPWFVYFLLGIVIFFTLYLAFPQFRYFKYALKIVRGKYDKEGDVGDTSHFQALTTALSGTVGTGNIAGVALAVHQGGPAALFWMLVTALLGMTTKFVEVTLSHKYREKADDGTIAGGPMYFMKKRLNIKRKNGTIIATGKWMAILFASATVLSAFGTGSLPQINSISNAIFATFEIPHILTGIVLSVLLGFVIIGGIKRIAKVTSTLVPVMAIFYFIGALFVIIYNYENIIPSLISIVGDVFTGSAATGGFLGATVAYAINRGVNRGLFSNEAGQGSAPIAHAAARAHEPVSEGLVALLEPFIDTIVICTLTGLTLLASGVWNEKTENQFQMADIEVLSIPVETTSTNILAQHIKGKKPIAHFDGELNIENGQLPKNITLIHARSLAEDVNILSDNKPYSGALHVDDGKIILSANGSASKSFKEWLLDLFSTVKNKGITINGKSLIHSAPLTTQAFTKSWLGKYGKYIVSIGLLLFAFSTAISWSYYGDRAITFLWGSQYVIWFRLVYVLGFFMASFIDTTIIWNLSYLTIAFMTVPNLIGIIILHKEVKTDILNFWKEYKIRFPNEKVPRY